MRVTVDRDLCNGHTQCNFVAPSLFGLDETGHAFVRVDEVDIAQEDAARLAASSCPEGAIQVDTGSGR
jgi:ferredoxin